MFRTIMQISKLLLSTVFTLYSSQRLFSKLLGKVKQQSDIVDKHAAAGVKAAELSALKPIVDKVGVVGGGCGSAWGKVLRFCCLIIALLALHVLHVHLRSTRLAQTMWRSCWPGSIPPTEELGCCGPVLIPQLPLHAYISKMGRSVSMACALHHTLGL